MSWTRISYDLPQLNSAIDSVNWYEAELDFRQHMIPQESRPF